MKLKNKVALVTGAGQGMGQATAELFAAAGAHVVAVDLNTAAVEQVVSGFDGPGDSIARGCDVSDSAAVAALFAEIESRYGRLDVLVNNAGVGSVPGDGLERYQQRLVERRQQQAQGEAPTVFTDMIIDLTDAGWQRVMEINLHAVFYCAREAVRLMIKAGTQGSIINISSTSAMTGDGPLSYCTTKAALLGLTKCLAKDLGPRGIRVNAVSPGATRTPMMAGIPDEWAQSIISGIPLGRMAEPVEVARTSLFLASDDASYITGQNLVANGGMYML